MDEKGRLLKNGKPMSDAAVDQRLRRWCTKKKGGGLKCPKIFMNATTTWEWIHAMS